jgi:uncharacterized membrane protein YfcA
VIHAGGATVDILSGGFALAALAAVVAGGLRGFSGFGSALVLSPALSAVYGPETAVPVALLLEFALAVPFVPPALRLIDRGRVALLCLAATAGIPLGAWVLVAVDGSTLRWVICAIVLVAVAMLAFGWRYHGRPGVPVTAATGAVSGVLSGSTGMSGPPVMFLYLSGTDPAARMRASFMVYFAWVDVAALTAFAVVGALSARALLVAAALVVPYLLAALTGARFFGRASDAFYRRLAVAVLLAVALASLPV